MLLRRTSITENQVSVVNLGLDKSSAVKIVGVGVGSFPTTVGVISLSKRS